MRTVQSHPFNRQMKRFHLTTGEDRDIMYIERKKKTKRERCGMRYTITEGVNEGKRINIPDEFIERSMAAYDLDRNGAIQMYLDDEGYMENEIVVALTEKAKAAGTTPKNQSENKKKRKAPVRKPDEMKRALIAAIAKSVEVDVEQIANEGEVALGYTLEVTNIERMIVFTIGEDKFELTLTKKRKAKE